MDDLAAEFSTASATLARRAADDAMAADPAVPRFVVGSSARPTGPPRSPLTSPTPAPAMSPSTTSSRRMPSRPLPSSTVASTCSPSRRSSTLSTPRRRSSPWSRCSRSAAGAGRSSSRDDHRRLRPHLCRGRPPRRSGTPSGTPVRSRSAFNCALGAAQMRPFIARPRPGRRHLRLLLSQRGHCPTPSGSMTRALPRPPPP